MEKLSIKIQINVILINFSLFKLYTLIMIGDILMSMFPKISRFIGTLFVAFVLSISILNIFSSPDRSGIFGFRGYTVISESMYPTLKVGEYIVIKPVDTSKLAPKEIITFKDQNMLVTHRIVSIDQDKITTKGDNNPIQDTKQVEKKDVIGHFAFHIPLIGYLMIWLQNPLIFSIVIGLLFFRLVYLLLFVK